MAAVGMMSFGMGMAVSGWNRGRIVRFSLTLAVLAYWVALAWFCFRSNQGNGMISNILQMNSSTIKLTLGTIPACLVATGWYRIGQRRRFIMEHENS